MKEFIIFVCTDSTEIFFSKLRSACFFGKMTAVRTYNYSPYMAFVYALIVPLWADQLLSQLLMKHFDTLSIQYRHIGYMHEGVYIFC